VDFINETTFLFLTIESRHSLCVRYLCPSGFKLKKGGYTIGTKRVIANIWRK